MKRKQRQGKEFCCFEKCEKEQERTEKEEEDQDGKGNKNQQRMTLKRMCVVFFLCVQGYKNGKATSVITSFFFDK